MFKYALYSLVLLSAFLQAQENNDNNQNAEGFGTNANNSVVSSNNNTNAVTHNYNGQGSGPKGMPVYSAIAPSLMSSGSDSCLISKSSGLQLQLIGASRGKYEQDEECNRRRDAKVLKDLGMTVAAVARMCESVETWDSMFKSGTPCPLNINGKLVVGKAAYLAMKREPHLYIPYYLKECKWTKMFGYIDCKKRKEYFNSILKIGIEYIQDEKTDNNLTISERFRTTSNRD